MGEVTTIGLDIAKSVFQVHSRVKASERQVVIRPSGQRAHGVLPVLCQDCRGARIGIEACATSHHWARELQRARA